MFVRCRDCGFLQASRLSSNKPGNIVSSFQLHEEIYEPNREERRNDDYRGIPICLRQMPHFDDEHVGRERHCSEFTEWDPGRSAEEHLQIREAQRRQQKQARQFWLNLGIGIATIIAVVGYGATELLRRLICSGRCRKTWRVRDE